MTDLDQLAAVQYGQPIAYSTPAPRPVRVPSYLGITVGARILIGFGIACVLIATLVLALAVYAVIAQPSGRGGLATLVVSPVVVGAAGMIGWGLMFVLVGTVAIAIRDIARNSFRR